MIERPGQQSIENRQPIEKCRQHPGNFLISKGGQADIVQEKGRTYIVAETKEIFSFFSGNLSLTYQVSDDFGAHGKAAQKPHKDSVTAFLRDAEQMSYDRGVDPIQILEHARPYEKSGDDQERKQGWKDRSVPELKSQRTACGCHFRMTEQHQKKAQRQQNEKYLFQWVTI